VPLSVSSTSAGSSQCSTSSSNTASGGGKLAARAIAGSPASVRLAGRKFPDLDAARAVAALQSDDPLTAIEKLGTIPPLPGSPLA
jgi:hypothetical protein